MSTLFDDKLTGADYDVEIKGTNLFHRVVLGMTVASLALGIASIFSFLAWWLLPFPLIGAVCGAIAVWKIMENPEAFTGFPIALAGLITSVVFGLFATGWLTWHYFNAVPSGYVALDFTDLAPDKDHMVPERIVTMAQMGQRVFIKGYMYQGNQMQGIDHFLLVRSVEHCKFCATQIAPTDMVDVRLVGGRTVAYRTKAVYVGGILHLRPRFSPGETPYYLEADVFR